MIFAIHGQVVNEGLPLVCSVSVQRPSLPLLILSKVYSSFMSSLLFYLNTGIQSPLFNSKSRQQDSMQLLY